MSDVVTAPPPATPPPGSANTVGDRVRFVMRGIGQTLITLGLVVLLFVVYEVWITNLFAHQAQHKVHTALENAWADGVDPLSGNPSGIPLGTGIANLYIPRLGRDYHFTVVQGADDSALEKGPGHYPGTALPGQIGNFAVAGHRVGKGEPFLNIDHLRPGDTLIVQTKTAWYVYVILGDVKSGNLAVTDLNRVPGREIVDPSQNQVIMPWPDHPGAPNAPLPSDRYMTLTTCHPKFTAEKRMIVHAQLLTADTVALPKGAPFTPAMPAPIAALYNAPGL
jgi:sortase A